MSDRLFRKIEPDPLGPPFRPGVYAVCTSTFGVFKEKILYIGSSKNIFKRVMKHPHPYRKLIDETSFPTLIYLKCIQTLDYVELEKKLIKTYKPKLNLQHTHG